MHSDARGARSNTGGWVVTERKASQEQVMTWTLVRIGGQSVGDMEKAGQKADSVQSIENRKFYETEEDHCQFIRESFQLDVNKILNADEKS